MAGGLLSIWTSRALGSMVIAAKQFDLVSIAVASAVLMVVGVAAVLPVVRRAARTDPLIALRAE
jgi:ABC-type antimicrobial peptide transport system permease subunit